MSCTFCLWKLTPRSFCSAKFELFACLSTQWSSQCPSLHTFTFRSICHISVHSTLSLWSLQLQHYHAARFCFVCKLYDSTGSGGSITKFGANTKLKNNETKPNPCGTLPQSTSWKILGHHHLLPITESLSPLPPLFLKFVIFLFFHMLPGLTPWWIVQIYNTAQPSAAVSQSNVFGISNNSVKCNMICSEYLLALLDRPMIFKVKVFFGSCSFQQVLHNWT